MAEMAFDADAHVANFVATLARESAAQLRENLCSWVAKQETLIQRFEVHDQCLERIATDFAYLYSSSARDVLQQKTEASPVIRSFIVPTMEMDQHLDQVTYGSPKLFMDECAHATLPDSVANVPNFSRHHGASSSSLLPVHPEEDEEFNILGKMVVENEIRTTLHQLSIPPTLAAATHSDVRKISTRSDVRKISTSGPGSPGSQSIASGLQRLKKATTRGMASHPGSEFDRYAKRDASEFSVTYRASNNDRYEHQSERSEAMEGVNTTTSANSSKSSRVQEEDFREHVTRLSKELDEALKPQLVGLAACVRSRWFQAFCAFVILCHMVLMIVETEYEATTLKSNDAFHYMNVGLNVWYGVEVIVKVVALRREFLHGPDKKWNIMDVALVVVSIIDFLVFSNSARSVNMTKSLRSLRLARLVRVFRIFRFMAFALEFQKMVLAMATCLNSFFWSMVVLAFVTWCFGIMLTQLVTAAWLNRASFVEQDSIIGLREMFASIPLAMYYLFQTVTTGIDWGPISKKLFEVDAIGGVLLVSYIAFTSFAVLNIVTSVFVESVLHATQHTRELLVNDRIRLRETYAKHVRAIFHYIDNDGSGLISLEEVELIFSDEGLRKYLDALEVNATDARMMFKLLDYDGSGQISSDEFVEGCLKLKGEAKSFDVYCLIYENERYLKSSQRFMQGTHLVLEAISGRVKEMSKLLYDVHKQKTGDTGFVPDETHNFYSSGKETSAMYEIEVDTKNIQA